MSWCAFLSITHFKAKLLKWNKLQSWTISFWSGSTPRLIFETRERYTHSPWCFTYDRKEICSDKQCLYQCLKYLNQWAQYPNALNPDFRDRNKKVLKKNKKKVEDSLYYLQSQWMKTTNFQARFGRHRLVYEVTTKMQI